MRYYEDYLRDFALHTSSRRLKKFYFFPCFFLRIKLCVKVYFSGIFLDPLPHFKRKQSYFFSGNFLRFFSALFSDSNKGRMKRQDGHLFTALRGAASLIPCLTGVCPQELAGSKIIFLFFPPYFSVKVSMHSFRTREQKFTAKINRCFYASP